MQVYQQAGLPGVFSSALRDHLTHGYVISTPLYFAMGRPVRISAPDAELSDIRKSFPDADGWFIWLAAGPIGALARLLPYPLPHIAFHRGLCLPLRVYPWARFAQLALHL